MRTYSRTALQNSLQENTSSVSCLVGLGYNNCFVVYIKVTGEIIEENFTTNYTTNYTTN